jgi:ADP-heptose:LPS heptosyltransferase
MNSPLIRLYKYFLTYGAAPAHRLRRRRRPLERGSLFIAKFDGLGDFFLLLPLLSHLRKAGHRITMSGNDFQKEIIAHCGLDIETIPCRTESSAALRLTLSAVEKIRPDFAINLSISAWGGILVNATRAPTMIGLVQEREWYVYKGVDLFYDRTVSYDPALHSFEVNNRLFSELLGIGRIDPHFEQGVTDSGEIALHPYGKWLPRRWPGFGELIARLTKAHYRCVILGTAAEHAGSALAAGIAGNSACRIVTLSSVSELCTEIEHCRAFIGNDSGPAHYAALIGKSTFVLWGPGDFERIRPLGSNVHIFKKDAACRPCRQRGEHCAQGESECLHAISVEEVVAEFSASIAS